MRGVEIDDGGGGGPGAGLRKAHVKWAATSSRGSSDSVGDGVVGDGGRVAGQKERAQDATRHYGRGTAFAEVGNYNRALICFNQALSLVSTQAPVWHGRGASLLGLGRYRDAVASFSQACALALTEELQLANGAFVSMIDNGTTIRSTAPLAPVTPQCLLAVIRARMHVINIFASILLS